MTKHLEQVREALAPLQLGSDDFDFVVMRANEVHAALSAHEEEVRELVEALAAIINNRSKCFIPEADGGCPPELLDWTERAEATLAKF